MKALFFSPYTLWTPHLYVETTLASALKQWGASTLFVTCGGAKECGMAPSRIYDHEEMCAACRSHSVQLLPGLRQKVRFMQSVLGAEEQAEILEWANGIPADGLRSAAFNGQPIGEWAWSDMVSLWHTLTPDLNTPEVADSYRGFLHGTALAATALPKIFDEFKPDLVVTLNGSFHQHRAAIEVAKARGIRFVTHERGWRDETILLNENAVTNDLDKFREEWEKQKWIPLTGGERAEAEALLNQRRSGKNMNWGAFALPPGERESGPRSDRTALGQAARLADDHFRLRGIHCGSVCAAVSIRVREADGRLVPHKAGINAGGSHSPPTRPSMRK